VKGYQKPGVLNAAYSPEPVEAGCCLRSCGGSPHHDGDSLAKAEKLTKRIDRALNQKTRKPHKR